MARKDVHSLVSGMGGACSIVETIVREARDCGVSDEAIHSLTTEKGRKIIRGWVQSLKEVAKSLLSLHDRILACKLDWWNENILKWRREDTPPAEISGKSALSEIDKLGFCPANIEELCDYGARNPEEQRKHPIVALGSVFVSPNYGYRYSPCLDESDTGRRLDLDWHGNVWSDDWRFLVVRK